MTLKWKENKNLKPKIILAKLNQARKKSGGRVSFDAFEKANGEAAICSMLEFGEDFPESQKENLVSEALLAIEEEINEQNFIKKINDIWFNKKKSPEQTFYLLTSVSLSTKFKIEKIEIEKCEIEFVQGNVSIVKFNEREKIFISRDWSKAYSPAKYQKVIIRTKSRDAFQAVENCLSALNIVRFALCMCSNHILSVTQGLKRTPINKILLGGIHTLHSENGNLVFPDETFWYEPNFIDVKIYHDNLDKLAIEVIDFVKRYNKSKISKDLKLSILNYMKGSDSLDYNTNIIMAWSSLEMLLSRGNDKNNDLISRRCSFLYEENEYHKQIIEHLREYRNRSVHKGSQSSASSVHCYQLQNYYFRLIHFYLTNSFDFQTIEETNNFLDLPTSKDILNSKIELFKKAVQFRKEFS